MSPVHRKGLLALSRIGKSFVRPVAHVSYVPELDGLRCLAILLVMAWHASLRASRYTGHLRQVGRKVTSFYADFPHGEIGVALFFLVSGFVVAIPFLKKPREQWDIKGFYLRRLRRIYPPYFVALMLCFFALAVLGHVPTDAQAFDQNALSLSESFALSLFYLHGLIAGTPSRLDPPLWSLEIEVLFYVLLPLVMMAYVRVVNPRIRQAAGLAFVALLVCAISTHASFMPEADGRSRLGLFYHAHLFAVGLVLADVLKMSLHHDRRRHYALDLFFVVGLGVLVVEGLWLTQHDARFPSGVSAAIIEAIQCIALVVVFVGALFGRISSAVLSWTWVRVGGTMCYSIYLTHVVIMQALGEALTRIIVLTNPVAIWSLWLGIMIPASVVVGFAFFLAVERPFMGRLASEIRFERAREALKH